MAEAVHFYPLEGLPEIEPGAPLGDLLDQAITTAGFSLQEGDVLVVAQKVVSKAEGRILRLDELSPSPFACALAERMERDPHLVEAVLRNCVRIVRCEPEAFIVETPHGFVCANAGIDRSNVAEEGSVVLLPIDPDASADKIRRRLEEHYGCPLAVIVSDTFGRPWRWGSANVAIGVSGIEPLTDLRGKTDASGRTLTATVLATADEIAAGAELCMGKADRIPAVLVRGSVYVRGEGRATTMVMDRAHDLFR